MPILRVSLRLWFPAIFFGLLSPALPAQGGSEVVVPTTTISLFNGKDLSHFYTLLRGLRYEDPDRVFTVVEQIDGAPAIRASGQHYGGIVTKERYANYRLTLEFRWGLLTWEPRKNRARDAGILLHCQGPDGNYTANFNGGWMRSVEFQIIEGGTGDMLLVGGFERPGGPRITPSITAPVRSVSIPGAKGGRVANYWDPQGKPTPLTGGRIDWYGRDPNWDGSLGYRGPRDLEKPVGEWNHLEAICDGDSLVFFVNGVKVNGGTGSSLREGKILFQSEGAEIFYRHIALHPLKR